MCVSISACKNCVDISKDCGGCLIYSFNPPAPGLTKQVRELCALSTAPYHTVFANPCPLLSDPVPLVTKPCPHTPFHLEMGHVTEAKDASTSALMWL